MSCHLAKFRSVIYLQGESRRCDWLENSRICVSSVWVSWSVVRCF